MPLKFHNTLSRSLEEFVPLDSAGKKVGLYCCGPTVHDFAHIGNFRTFVFADLVRRYLEFKGYAVTHVMNITDVEDKIIKRVAQQQTTLRDYTGRYEAEFLKDFDALGCLRPTLLPRATEHIEEIKTMIGRLMERGIAYQAADGSIYFSIGKYQGCGCKYGQLLNLNFEGMRAGERVASDEYEKESVADFALWKARVPEDGDVFWPSPWGEGRPGWHIECSAMSTRHLGPSFDLHLGGEDLIFPHHEDEIAQSEGAWAYPAGSRFVKYWLHGAHLLVEGKKMSKSLGNFFTLRDLLAKGFTGREIRFLLLSAHYRETFNFTLEGLHGSRAALARIDECLGKLRELANGIKAKPDLGILNAVTDSLDEDLNVSAAWGVVFSWVREKNRLIATGNLSPEQGAAALAAWDRINSVLGLGNPQPRAIVVDESDEAGMDTGDLMVATGSADIPNEIMMMLPAREDARKRKDFKRADAIRNELKAKGWVIEDTPKGPRLKRL